MALIVETGTGVAGAQTYVSVTDFRTYATARGITLPVADATVEQLLIKAVDHLELNAYIGEPTTETQGLSWPRTTTDIYGIETDEGVPAAIVRAQELLAIEAQNGALDIAARQNAYKRTKIDVLYIEYHDAATVSLGLSYPAVDALLRPWLRNSGTFTVVRA